MLRVTRIAAGMALVVLGLFLLVLPGPGILTIAGGLAILAVDFAWARNLLDWMKRRFRDYFTVERDSTPKTPLPGSAGTPPNASLGGETTDHDYEGG